MAAPANDNLADAQVLTSGTSVTGTTAEATAQVSEVTGNGDNNTVTLISATGYRTVWFRWTAPSASPATFTTVGSNFDSVLSVWRASPGQPDPVTSFANLTFVKSDDESGGSSNASLTFTPVSGVSYYLQVRHYNTGASGNYVLNYPTPGGVVEPAEGESALGLDLGVAAAGARDSRGAAAVGLGMAAAVSGSASASGAVALTLGLSAAATGARASLGAAAVGLGLAPAAAGVRSSGGAAAVGLSLAISASGSNGDTGRPVTPFPFTPEPGSSYPWTPRPVKSFQEVSP
jgi:hypothetical protein